MLFSWSIRKCWSILLFCFGRTQHRQNNGQNNGSNFLESKSSEIPMSVFVDVPRLIGPRQKVFMSRPSHRKHVYVKAVPRRSQTESTYAKSFGFAGSKLLMTRYSWLPNQNWCGPNLKVCAFMPRLSCVQKHLCSDFHAFIVLSRDRVILTAWRPPPRTWFISVWTYQFLEWHLNL